MRIHSLAINIFRHVCKVKVVESLLGYTSPPSLPKNRDELSPNEEGFRTTGHKGLYRICIILCKAVIISDLNLVSLDKGQCRNKILLKKSIRLSLNDGSITIKKYYSIYQGRNYFK